MREEEGREHMEGGVGLFATHREGSTNRESRSGTCERAHGLSRKGVQCRFAILAGRLFTRSAAQMEEAISVLKLALEEDPSLNVMDKASDSRCAPHARRGVTALEMKSQTS